MPYQHTKDHNMFTYNPILSDFIRNNDASIRKHISYKFHLSKTDQNDFTQTMYLHFFEHNTLEKYDSTRPFPSWIIRVINNQCMNYIRNNKKYQYTELIDNIEVESVDKNLWMVEDFISYIKKHTDQKTYVKLMKYMYRRLQSKTNRTDSDHGSATYKNFIALSDAYIRS
jgi:hypothetical protein